MPNSTHITDFALCHLQWAKHNDIFKRCFLDRESGCASPPDPNATVRETLVRSNLAQRIFKTIVYSGLCNLNTRCTAHLLCFQESLKDNLQNLRMSDSELRKMTEREEIFTCEMRVFFGEFCLTGGAQAICDHLGQDSPREFNATCHVIREGFNKTPEPMNRLIKAVEQILVGNKK